MKLQTYEDFQDPRLFDQAVFTEGIKKVSQREKEMDIRAVFIDGKRFLKQDVIIVLVAGSSGQKYALGIFQADTVNSKFCLNSINDLGSHCLPKAGLVFAVDGGSGLKL